MYVYVLIYTYFYYCRSLFEPEPDDAKREFVTHLFLSVCALPRHTHALCVFLWQGQVGGVVVMSLS